MKLPFSQLRPNPSSRMGRQKPQVHSQIARRRRLTLESLEPRNLLAGLVSAIAGRGQDLLLLVNPNDENAVRIAGEYQQLRHIPDNNILFIAPPVESEFKRLTGPAEEWWFEYVAEAKQEIERRGLENQIDFIAALGQTPSYSENGNYQSLSFGLMQLDQYFAGMTVTQGQSITPGTGIKPTVEALHHDDVYRVSQGGQQVNQQYYVSGVLAIT